MSEPLQNATRALIGARSDREIQRAAITAMDRLLDADLCTLTNDAPGSPDADRPGPAGRAPAPEHCDTTVERPSIGREDRSCPTDGPCVIDDIEAGGRPVGADVDPGRTHRSLLRVPVADGRALIALASEPAAFDADDLDAVVELGACVEAALQRVAADPDRRDAGDRTTEIADVLSHDVQNSLTIATGHLELARDGHDGDHLERVAVAHERIGELVDDVVTLARTGDRVETIEPLDLSEAVELAWTNVETPTARVRVVDSPTIRADASSLRQLLENLFRNAVEHGSTSSPSHAREDGVEQAAPEVSIRIGTLDEGTGFYVEDDGPGIPPAERRRVFVSGHSTSADGTGFGLSIVRRIADVHGWDVEVTESEAGGARFEITGVEFAPPVAYA